MKSVAAIALFLLTACAPMSGAGSGKSIELDGTRFPRGSRRITRG